MTPSVRKRKRRRLTRKPVEKFKKYLETNSKDG